MKIKDLIQSGVTQGDNAKVKSDLPSVEGKIDFNKTVKMFILNGYQARWQDGKLNFFRHKTTQKKTIRYDVDIDTKEVHLQIKKLQVSERIGVDKFKAMMDKQDPNKYQGFEDDLIALFDSENQSPKSETGKSSSK